MRVPTFVGKLLVIAWALLLSCSCSSPPRPSARFAGHEGGTLGLAYSPDGNLLASSGMDHTIRIWDAASARELLVIRPQRRVQVHGGLAFSPDSSVLAAAQDNDIALYDVASGAMLRKCQGHSLKV